MAGTTDPKTTIVDALLVGYSSFGPVQGQTIMDVNTLGVTVTPYANRHFSVTTDTAGHIYLDTYDSGNARGNINLEAGTTVAMLYGQGPLTPGTSQWYVYDAENSKYMLECNGLGTLEVKEHIDYVEDGDELWDLLVDSTERVIYLRPGVTYDLPTGTGTRTITNARKTVIGCAAPRSAALPIIRLTGSDYLYVQEKCVFENIKFAEDWVPTYPQYLIRCIAEGASSVFRGCVFDTRNAPTLYVLLFGAANYSHMMENCYFEDVPAAVGACMRSFTAQNSVVRDCTFEGGTRGLYYTGTGWSNAIVEHNEFISNVASSEICFHSTAEGDSFHIRNNRFIKGPLGAPAPVIHCTGAGVHYIEGNYIETEHTSSVTWGSEYLVHFEGGDVHFLNNTVKGQEMDQTVSGLVGVGPSVDSFSCIGNHFIGGTDLTKVLVFDTLGTADKPGNIQVNDNLFEGLLAASDAYITFQDSTSGSNDYSRLGTIANNIFTGPSAVAINAIAGAPPSSQEMIGFSILGNILNESVTIQQGGFRTSIFTNNINADGNTVVTPSTPQGNNIVDHNL